MPEISSRRAGPGSSTHSKPAADALELGRVVLEEGRDEISRGFQEEGRYAEGKKKRKMRMKRKLG